jgi:hypothetical protein
MSSSNASSSAPAPGRTTQQRDPVAFGWFILFVVGCLAALIVGLLRLAGFREPLGVSWLQVPVFAFMAFLGWRSARGRLVLDESTLSRPGGVFSWTIARRQIAGVAAVRPPGRATTYLVVVPTSDCPPNRIASWWSRLWVPIEGLPPTALLCPIPADVAPEFLEALGFGPRWDGIPRGGGPD